MAQYEYKVVPAPTKGEKVKGVKQPEARFAHSVEATLNRMAESGWEFVRAEMLPNEERSGLSKTTKEWRNLLIFRRARVEQDKLDPALSAAPEPSAAHAPSVAPKPPLGAVRAPDPAGARAEEPAPLKPSEPKVLRAVETDVAEGESSDAKPTDGPKPVGSWQDRS